MTDTQHDWRKDLDDLVKIKDRTMTGVSWVISPGAEHPATEDFAQFIKDLLKQRDEELVAKIHERLRLPVDDVGELEDELIALVRESGI